MSKDGKINSQKIFEEHYLTLPHGFVGYFAHHFEQDCNKNVSELKKLIENVRFDQGCYGNTGDDWDLYVKIDFLLNQIEQWDGKMYWPQQTLVTVIGATAAVIAGFVGSDLISSDLVESIHGAINDNAGCAAQETWRAVLEVIQSSCKVGNDILIPFTKWCVVATVVCIVAVIIFEYIKVHSRNAVSQLREALLIVRETYCKGDSAICDECRSVEYPRGNKHFCRNYWS